MSDAAEKLKPALAALPAADRAELIEYLVSLDEADDESLTQEQWEEAWAAEIDRRIADAEAGKTVAVPAEEFMRRMKEKYG